MLIRFIIGTLDPDSGRRQGLFQAAAALQDSGRMVPLDHEMLDSIFQWFRKNLEKPTRLAVSSRPHSKAQALSWFKDSATSHIAKMRELGEILDRYGIAVEMIKTDRPGYILYEDEYQIAAYPFSDTQT